MTADLHGACFGLAASNPDFAGVAGVDDAFLLAVPNGMTTRGPCAADASSAGPIDLCWNDNLHASKYGSCLSALTLFGSTTGVNPFSLGAGEIAARGLGISSTDAVALQRIAAMQPGFAAPEPGSFVMATLALVGLAAGLRHRKVWHRALPWRGSVGAAAGRPRHRGRSAGNFPSLRPPQCRGTSSRPTA